MGNQRGSISLLGVSLTCVLVLCALIFMGQKLEQIRLTKERTSVYLCAHAYLVAQKSYISTMVRLNKSIRLFHTLKHSPSPKISIPAKSMHQMATLTQQVWHVAYMKKVAGLPHCSGPLRAYLVTHSPYQTLLAIKLVRNFEGVAQLKPKSPHFYLPSSSNLSRVFLLEVSTQLKSPFDNQPKVSISEHNKQDLLNWKQLFGLVY